jgi:hypothetical protein
VDLSLPLKALEDTGFSTTVRDSLYLFPFIESVHVMALSVVFGTISIVDLRLLGLASSSRPFGRMSTELLRLTWGAFGLAALTGLMMFATNARVYADNTAFRVKMLLLVLAGINMVIFQLTTGRSAERWGGAPAAPRSGRIAAVCSLSLWIAIIFAGRVIGFTTTGAEAKEAPAPTQNFEDFLNDAPASAAPAPSPALKDPP